MLDPANRPRIAKEIVMVDLGDFQRRIVETCAAAVEATGREMWGKGRGAGKSVTRAAIAQAILDADDGEREYEVRPVITRYDRP